MVICSNPAIRAGSIFPGKLEFLDPILYVFHKTPVDGQKVREKSSQHGLEADAHQDRSKYQRLDMSRASVGQVIIEKSEPADQSRAEKRQSYRHEEPEGLVDDEDPDDGDE